MKRPTARAFPWLALLLSLIPTLLAAKGCYFGEQDVPLGGNLKNSAAGQASAGEPGSDGGSAASGGCDAGSEPKPGTEMREPGVFVVH